MPSTRPARPTRDASHHRSSPCPPRPLRTTHTITHTHTHTHTHHQTHLDTHNVTHAHTHHHTQDDVWVTAMQESHVRDDGDGDDDDDGVDDNCAMSMGWPCMKSVVYGV